MTNNIRLYKVGDLCEIFDCNKSTIWRWVDNETLPKPMKFGGSSRWDQSVLVSVIETARARSSADTPRQATRSKLRRLKTSKNKNKYTPPPR